MTKRLLLIGASSPLGMAIGRSLSHTEIDVIATSRSGLGENLDVRDGAHFGAILRKVRPHSLVYLPSPPVADLENTSVADEMNQAFSRALRLASEVGVEQFVFASSAAVYGTEATMTSFSENSPLVGASGYARFKIESERIAATFPPLGMSVLALRYFNIYGPGFRRSLINRLADPQQRPALRVDAGFVRDYVHADDAAAATIAAIRHDGRAGSRTYNVGTSRGTSNARLIELVQRHAYDPVAAGEPSHSVADVRLAVDELRFVSTISVEQALSDPVRFGLREPGS